MSLPKEEFVHPGTRACTGCGLAIAYRVGLKALGKDTMLIVPPSCLTVLQGLFPVASTKLPCLNVTFASTAAAATGILAALKTRGNNHTAVAAWAGDGGTSDIGLQALSGAAERGDNFIYFCYDNEGYMNTGVQRSGTTPIGAITANTPFKGKLQQKKDVPAIMAAHNLSYVAACSAAYPLDLYDKVKNCLELPGTKYFHIHIPCPPGWEIRPAIRNQNRQGSPWKRGIMTSMRSLKGEFKLTAASEKLLEKRKLVPVREYFRSQSRFKVLTDEQIDEIQRKIDKKWERLLQEGRLG